MKNIVLGTLIAAAASQAAGCVAKDDNPPPDDFATVKASWKIATLPGDVDIGCPPGFTTATLYSVEADADGTVIQGGHQYADKFDCVDKSGFSDPMVPSIYRSHIAIENDNGSQTYAKTIEVLLDVTNEDKDFSATLYDNAGYFQLSWDLVGKVSGDPLTCAQAGADGVDNLATDVATPTNFKSDIFPCEDGFGITNPIPEGTYTVSVSAVQGDAAVGVAPTLTDKRITGPNNVTDLGNIQIPIDGQ